MKATIDLDAALYRRLEMQAAQRRPSLAQTWCRDILLDVRHAHVEEN